MRKVSIITFIVVATAFIGWNYNINSNPSSILENDSKKEVDDFSKKELTQKRRLKYKGYLKEEFINEGGSETEDGMRKMVNGGIQKYNLDPMIDVFSEANNKNLSDAFYTVLSSNLEEYEKSFLIKRILDKINPDEINLIQEVALEMTNLQLGLSSKSAKEILLYSVSVSGKHNISEALSYMDENDDLFKELNFDGGDSFEKLKKSLYENAYHASMKNGDYYALVHVLNNPLYKNNKKAFLNLFADVDHTTGANWLELNRSLLSDEQFAEAIRSMHQFSMINEGLTGINGDHSENIKELINSNKIDEAKFYADLIKDDFSQADYVKSFVHKLASKDFDEANEWLNTIENDYIKNGVIKSLSSSQVHKDYNRIYDWAMNLEEGSTAQAYALSNIAVQQGMYKSLDDKPIDWFSNLPQGLVKDRTQIGYALGLSRQYNDSNLEFTLKKMFIKDEFDRDASIEAINDSKLPSNIKESLALIISK